MESWHDERGRIETNLIHAASCTLAALFQWWLVWLVTQHCRFATSLPRSPKLYSKLKQECYLSERKMPGLSPNLPNFI